MDPEKQVVNTNNTFLLLQSLQIMEVTALE